MTFAAAKLVRVPIFVLIGKAIAKKNEHGRTDGRTHGHTHTQSLFIYIEGLCPSVRVHFSL